MLLLWLLGALFLWAFIKNPRGTSQAVYNAYRGQRTEGQSAKVLRWAPLIKERIAKAGIRGSLASIFFWWTLATMHHESGGNPKATSYKTRGTNNKGREFVLDAWGRKIPLAQGLGQFIKAAQQQFGVSNPYDPVQAIDGMLRLFAALWRKSGGSLPKMAQAYYSGGMKPLAPRIAEAANRGEAKKVRRLKDIQAYVDKNMSLYETYKTVPF